MRKSPQPLEDTQRRMGKEKNHTAKLNQKFEREKMHTDKSKEKILQAKNFRVYPHKEQRCKHNVLITC